MWRVDEDVDVCVLKKPLSLAAGKAVDRGKKRKVIVYGFLAKVVY